MQESHATCFGIEICKKSCACQEPFVVNQFLYTQTTDSEMSPEVILKTLHRQN